MIEGPSEYRSGVFTYTHRFKTKDVPLWWAEISLRGNGYNFPKDYTFHTVDCQYLLINPKSENDLIKFWADIGHDKI